MRIRTRLPVVLPERIDDGFLEAWSPRLRVQRAMVVLLAGVNDSVEALADLSEALVGHGVLPYCLHVLDPVRGAAHFDVPELVVRRLVAERLPGYRVPRLVRQVPGATGKTMLPPASR